MYKMPLTDLQYVFIKFNFSQNLKGCVTLTYKSKQVLVMNMPINNNYVT